MLSTPSRLGVTANPPPIAVAREPRRAPKIDWRRPGASAPREYVEVAVVIAAITAAGWFVPITYRSFGYIYLLAVIALNLRVGRGPVLAAALLSAIVWTYVFIPPRLSFSILEVDDVLLLVALIGGQLTARIRAQERTERSREQRATALFHLTRALATARTLGEAAQAALRQADELFHARTALLLTPDQRRLVAHDAGSFQLDDRDRAVADWAWRHGREAGRFTAEFPSVEGLHLPMLRADVALGVLVLRLPDEVTALAPAQRELMDSFAAQIALLVEREGLRAASEREKLFKESDRLRQTLLDSVSHELKTPLAVLRSAAEKWDSDDVKKRAALSAEILTATSRLDRLVANLLNQTRLEAGGVRPRLDWCDVRDIAGAARRAVGEALAGRPLKIEFPPDLPLLLADAPLMEQVLANLLLNAARHTPAGTPIAIRAGVEHATTRVFISVIDRGPGVPRELRDHLIQKFRRGAGARAGGLGLGLSIVKGFMSAQGGEVVVRDHPGGGAVFTVYLPYVEPGDVPGDEH